MWLSACRTYPQNQRKAAKPMEEFLRAMSELAYLLGWLIFLYLGGAGAYELLGGRRYRAALLLAGAFFWIVLTFVYFRFTSASSFRVAFVLLYFVACVILARKVQGELGKPDIR